MQLYNTRTHKTEEFHPIGDIVGLYTCGPTVYNFAHIGNLRTYIFEDILKRVLVYDGYRVRHVMNITDVGHLTGDRDMGEDKVEASARKTGQSAWDIALFFEQAFRADIEKLNIIEPDIWCRATEHIEEQIAMIKILEEKGFTYRTSDGIYFDTIKFPEYGTLSGQNLDALLEGARVERNDEKRNATDFALWKFSPANSHRQMEWESPWGVGFPGWHIECSAMSMKYLKDNLDIHCGGMDHVNVHHTNEIAQSEAATGKKFFNFWLHGAFLNIEGGKKMAKSEGNFLTIANTFDNKGMSPLVFRFACLQVYYRKPMEYSEEIMDNAERGFDHLRNQVMNLGRDEGSVNEEFRARFQTVLDDDLNTPQVLAIAQELLKSSLSSADKLATMLDFDQVLGLGLDKLNHIPDEIIELAERRKTAKLDKNFEESDRLRSTIEEQGFTIKDGTDGTYVMGRK